MVARELTDTEREFADALAELLTSFEAIHAKAQAVSASGGDCREAFLSVLSDEDKPAGQMQWPYISMLFGV